MPYVHIPVSGLDKLQEGSASRVVVTSRLRAERRSVMIWKAEAHFLRSDIIPSIIEMDLISKSRLRAAWLVLIGKADAVVWE
jgi:hypothetical protein